MTCYLVNTTAETKARQTTALDRLSRMLADGTVAVVISSTGAIAFKGMGLGASAVADLAGNGLADVCVYRRLLASNSPGLRRAIAKAEVYAGRKVNEQAIASGQHSHDGGKSWGSH